MGWVCLAVALAALFQAVLLPGAHGDQAGKATLGLRQIPPSRLMLRMASPPYANYAHRRYVNYRDHTAPYADHASAYFGALGNPLISGYEIFSWTERRGFGGQYGSAIFKDINVFRPVFEHLMVGRDGYGDWGYSMMVGDDMIARLSPLTLSQVTFNGARLDAHLPQLQFSLMASRYERPWHWVEGSNIEEWMAGRVHHADASTMLLGSRVETQIGAARLGLNAANLHVFHSTGSDNSLKGVIRPDFPRIDWLGLRFSDDSPIDGRGGAVVQDVKLFINGAERPDLAGNVIKHNSLVKTAIGSFSRSTGAFQALSYRGRSGLSFFADYLYRIQHQQGIDVGEFANVELLVNTFVMPPPDAVLHADGEDWVVVLYDLSEVPVVKSAEFEVLLANDYRVDVFFLTKINDRADNEARRWRTSTWLNRMRSPGNIQDLSNLHRVRFTFGEETSLFTYSADLELKLPGFELSAEYARSSKFLRYPSFDGDQPAFEEASHQGEHGSAYFVNASRWLDYGLVGAELFAINPDFKTSLIGHRESRAAGELFGVNRANAYGVSFIQDNDDGDHLADGGPRPISQPSLGGDIDGVFPNQDEDNDGIPDTNRNYNGTPDWDEPFLMFDADPNEYAYGLDRNNNDEPDHREDDSQEDLPYDADQRGYHLFAQSNPTRHWSIAAGKYRARQLAGSGRNQVLYGLLTYRRRSAGPWRRVFFESQLRRVRDNIQDPYVSNNARPTLGLYFDFRGYEAVRGSIQQALQFPGTNGRTDFLAYQDSRVSETYLETVLRPLPALELNQRIRVRLNWQQGRELPGGLSQRRRRLDFWAVITRGSYTRHWGKLVVRPRLKLMLLRLVDQDADRIPGGGYAARRLISEYQVIPILLVSYAILPRTELKLGLQGFGPLPYRVKDQVDEVESFEERLGIITATNRSLYFGYDLYTTIGLQRTARHFDAPRRRSLDIDNYSFFVRALIGFTEYGRVI